MLVQFILGKGGVYYLGLKEINIGASFFCVVKLSKYYLRLHNNYFSMDN